MLDANLPNSTVEQARLDLSMAAGAGERANRPRALLFGAVALLAAAVVYAIVGLGEREGALGRVETARKNADEVIRLVNQVRALQDTLAKRGLDPNPRIASSLEELARFSGTTLSGPVTDTPGTATGQAGMTQKRYTARFVNQQPDALLQFLNATQEAPETAGVEFARINLLPGVADPTTGQVLWNLDVDFTRWERQSRQ